VGLDWSFDILNYYVFSMMSNNVCGILVSNYGACTNLKAFYESEDGQMHNVYEVCSKVFLEVEDTFQEILVRFRYRPYFLDLVYRININSEWK
jgi:hypothetical protein